MPALVFSLYAVCYNYAVEVSTRAGLLIRVCSGTILDCNHLGYATIMANNAQSSKFCAKSANRSILTI